MCEGFVEVVSGCMGLCGCVGGDVLGGSVYWNSRAHDQYATYPSTCVVGLAYIQTPTVAAAVAAAAAVVAPFGAIGVVFVDGCGNYC